MAITYLFLQPVKDILIPKYQEHSVEELQTRAELLAAYEAQAAARIKAEDQAKSDTKASGPSANKDVDMDAESSSSEDTSDEAFARTHTVEEERERAKYEGRSFSSVFPCKSSIIYKCWQYYLRAL